MKQKKTEQDFKVGIFVSIGLAFLMVAILVLGGSENAFTRKTDFRSQFTQAAGLLPGAKVVLSGVNVGTVREVDFDPETKKIEVRYGVENKYAQHLRAGTEVEIATQGVLGDKYLALTPGEGDSHLQEDSIIPTRPQQDITEIISKSDQLLANLTSATASLDRVLRALEKGDRLDRITDGLAKTSQNLSKFTEELDSRSMRKATQELATVLEKVNNGTGTLGALVNDPSLYEDARALVGGANRNRIMRNLIRKSAKEGAANASD